MISRAVSFMPSAGGPGIADRRPRRGLPYHAANVELMQRVVGRAQQRRCGCRAGDRESALRRRGRGSRHDDVDARERRARRRRARAARTARRARPARAAASPATAPSIAASVSRSAVAARCAIDRQRAGKQHRHDVPQHRCGPSASSARRGVPLRARADCSQRAATSAAAPGDAGEDEGAAGEIHRGQEPRTTASDDGIRRVEQTI